MPITLEIENSAGFAGDYWRIADFNGSFTGDTFLAVSLNQYKSEADYLAGKAPMGTRSFVLAGADNPVTEVGAAGLITAIYEKITEVSAEFADGVVS